jgi:hypothetical protein
LAAFDEAVCAWRCCRVTIVNNGLADPPGQLSRGVTHGIVTWGTVS